MIGIGPKIVATKVDFTAPLNKFFKNHVKDAELVQKLTNTAAELTSTRNRLAETFSNNSLELKVVEELIPDYLATMFHMDKRFKFGAGNDPNSINIDFVFHETFIGYEPIGMKTLQYEIASIALNLGALYSRLGVDSKPNDLTQAATYFRKAAGVYEWIMNTVNTSKFRVAVLDLHQISLKYFSKLMLAQAQTCVFEKACDTYMAAKKGESTAVTMSPATIAQVGAGVAELYKAAFGLLESNPSITSYFKGIKPNSFDWISYTKHQYYACLAAANLWEGKHQLDIAQKKDRKNYGMEILYLAFCMQYCRESAKYEEGLLSILPKAVESRRDLYASAARRYDVAKKDNDSIYFTVVPDTGPVVASKVLATPIAYELDLSKYDDVFKAVINPEIQAAYESCASQADQLFQAKTTLYMNQSTNVQDQLNQMQLENMLLNTSEVPEELQRRLRGLGGTTQASIKSQMTQVEEKCAQIETACRSLLDGIREEEDQYWQCLRVYEPTNMFTMMNSNRLNRSYIDEVNQYAEIGKQTEERVHQILSKLAMHKGDIMMIQKPFDEIMRGVPEDTPNPEVEAQKKVVQGIHDEITQVQADKTERYTSMESKYSTWKTQLPDKLTNGSSVDRELKLAQSILDEYNVNDLLEKEKKLLTMLRLEVGVLTSLLRTPSARATYITKLHTACEVVEQVLRESSDMIRSLDDVLSTDIPSVGQKTRDFIAGRKTEREDFIQRIEATIPQYRNMRPF